MMTMLNICFLNSVKNSLETFLMAHWKTLTSNAGGMGSIPRILQALWPENQNVEQKQYCNKLSKDFFENDPH